MPSPGPVVVATGHGAHGNGNGPPPWAPAHGRRAKHKYHYYPSVGVYFAPVRNLWFYPAGVSWRVSARLPGTIVLAAATYVSLDMEVDKPYLHHKAVVKRHPPNKHKQKKGKGKGKWKHSGNHND